MALVKASSDDRAIRFGGFALGNTGLAVHGRPAFEHFASAFEYSLYTEQRAGLWLADLLTYAKSRQEWRDLVAQLVSADLLTANSVSKYLSVGRKVPPERRVEGLGIGHVIEVAALRAGDQTEMLQAAKDNHWSTAKLRREVRRTKQTRILKGQSSELAAAQQAIVDTAWEAKEACKAITADDCKNAEAAVESARGHLIACETAIRAFRQLTGQKQ